MTIIKWNVATFFESFANGTLGRKTQYSTYWVNKFEGCNILCNKSTGSSKVKVIGVYMGPDLCIFNSEEFPGGDFYPTYIMSFRGVDMEEITESGIIDIEVTAGNKTVKSILFQLGTECYFIEPAWAYKDCISYENYIEMHKKPEYDVMANYPAAPGKVMKYGHSHSSRAVGANIVKLKGKYSSVNQARIASIPNEVKADPKSSFTFRNWWFTPQPSYIPMMLSKELQDLLENPPMPWHYGLTIDTVKPILSGISPIEENSIKLKSFFGSELSNKLKLYKEKKDKYEKAIASLQSLYVDQDGNHQAFGEIAILPGAGDFGVQRIEDGSGYYVRGILADRAELGSAGFRYGGLERLVKARTVYKLTQWHSMVSGVGYV